MTTYPAITGLPAPILRPWRGAALMVVLGLVMAIGVWGVSPAAMAAALSPQQQNTLTSLENRFLGADTPSLPLENRLDTLETVIFGHTYSESSTDVRLGQLQSAVPAPPPAEPELISQPQAMAPVNTAPPVGGANTPVASDAPIVDDMERQAYGRTFNGQPLEQRLSRLEERYLGTIQRGDLASRVDNLRWLVLGGTNGNNSIANGAMPNDMLTPSQTTPYAQPYNPYAAPNATPGGLPPGALASTQPGQPVGVGQQYNPYTGGGAVSPATMADMGVAVTTLENDILKQNYSSQPMGARLERLEMAVFQQSAVGSGLSDEERLQRLMAVSVAKRDNQTNRARSGGIKSLWPLIPMIVLMLL